MSQRQHLVVIGNGMVSHEFCRQAAQQGLTVRYKMTVFGEEKLPAYDRIRLTEVIEGRSPDDLVLHRRNWYERQGIDLITGKKVEHIDRSQQRLELADGDILTYDKIVLATGSNAYLPPIPGIDLPNVLAIATSMTPTESAQRPPSKKKSSSSAAASLA